MQKVFDGLISTWDITKEINSELEDRSVETYKNEQNI